MSETLNTYRAIAEHVKNRSHLSRNEAEGQFRRAAELASNNGMRLLRRSHDHYQLIGPASCPFLQNIYPGNRRLYYDRNHKKPPFVDLPSEWSLRDVVKAHAVKIGAEDA